MRAAKLRHRIAINSVSTAKDSAGAASKATTLLANCWADVNESGGSENWADQNVLTTYDAVVTIRYRDDLAESMQIDHQGKTFEIKAIIDPYGIKEQLKLMCKRYG